jgi:hypothetical protein
MKFSSLLSLLLTLGLTFQTMGHAFAEPVELDVGGVCCEKIYKVYGDEQPVAGKDADGNITCKVTVDIDPIVSPEQLAEDTANAGKPATNSGFGTAAESLVSPFAAVFSGLGLKQRLQDLAGTVFTGHTEKYHEFLDEEVFAPSIAIVSKRQSSDDLEKLLKSYKDGCDSTNPLPNCVVERAFCSYEKYNAVLFHQAGQQFLNNSTSKPEDVQSILSSLQNRDQALFQEAVQAEQALGTAMAVYSQFFETYRLHLRFKEIIAALVKVRNVTSSLRQLVGCIPNKFVGVATTKCN